VIFWGATSCSLVDYYHLPNYTMSHAILTALTTSNILPNAYSIIAGLSLYQQQRQANKEKKVREQDNTTLREQCHHILYLKWKTCALGLSGLSLGIYNNQNTVKISTTWERYLKYLYEYVGHKHLHSSLRLSTCLHATSYPADDKSQVSFQWRLIIATLCTPSEKLFSKGTLHGICKVVRVHRIFIHRN